VATAMFNFGSRSRSSCAGGRENARCGWWGKRRHGSRQRRGENVQVRTKSIESSGRRCFAGTGFSLWETTLLVYQLMKLTVSLARLGESVLVHGYQIYTFCLVVICWAKSEMETLEERAWAICPGRIVVVGVLNSCWVTSAKKESSNGRAGGGANNTTWWCGGDDA
jgi:hypothetical protein